METIAEKKEATKTEADKKSASTPRSNQKKGSGMEQRRGRKPLTKNRRRSFRKERVKPEFDQKILAIRRVARVVAGGRRFSFSVALVAGNRNGSVGVGIGKASDTALAIEKAARDAKKNMVKLPLTKEKSISHDVGATYSGTEVQIFPAPDKGVSAGSAVRAVLDLAGIKDVGAKVLSRSKNKLNIARASVKALAQLR